MIVGITGKSATGKDTVARYFEEHGFEKISLSQEIREELWKEDKELTRENQQDKGDELRREHGNAVLAERAISNMEEGKDYVVVSIRNPGEVERLREEGNFYLVNVRAPEEKRLKLAKKARATSDRKDTAYSKEDFERMDERESHNDEDFRQQLDKVAEMADRNILNNGTMVELRRKCEGLMRKLHEQ